MRTMTIDYHKWMLMLVILIGTMGLAMPAFAEQEYGMRHGGMHGGMGMHGGPGTYGASWKATLTDEQRAKLAKLKLDHIKMMAPLKVKIKGVKVELATLVTADKPDMSAINKKVDELTGMKNQKMKKKYEYIAAKRKVLNAEQQVLFDLHVMKKAMHDKGKGRGKH